MFLDKPSLQAPNIAGGWMVPGLEKQDTEGTPGFSGKPVLN